MTKLSVDQTPMTANDLLAFAKTIVENLGDDIPVLYRTAETLAGSPIYLPLRLADLVILDTGKDGK